MYELFADASGLHNPRRSGWGYVLRHPCGRVTEAKGSVPRLNVNRAELLAVLEGLDVVPAGSAVRVHTDSIYVIVRAKRPRLCLGPLGERLVAHKSNHRLKFIKVGAHPDHTKAHHLAREAAFNGDC